MNQNIDSEQARQQLDTLEHLRRRVHQRVDTPALLLFALGLFLTLALKQFGDHSVVDTLSLLALPAVTGIWLIRQPARPRLSFSDSFAVIALILWLWLFISLAYWNPFSWVLVWPIAGSFAALPLVVLAWSRRG
ncbi:hypothetical protein [Deinococcus humi]|uniref:Uncharacterized protein n=1 Tax=Deinococcus humi TaxID=662880 RepID=A0A7W8JXP7_9DEIO|nr:hypothetical protein [Deinococcus humi]MBB5363564.1 hypothetical protein [Deinococcus humi]GGO30235.1 hypothetical protein GCM10008949_24820 [Deinococcus humi]